MLKFTPLLLEEIAANGGFTHFVAITTDHLTQATANTAQALELPTIPIGWILNKGYAKLVVPFEDVSDAAYNTTTFILGDAGDDDRYITSAQLNRNGTEITVPKFGNTPYQMTAGTQLLATFGSMAAKSLSNLDKGEVHIVVQIIDTSILSDLHGISQLVGT